MTEINMELEGKEVKVLVYRGKKPIWFKGIVEKVGKDTMGRYMRLQQKKILKVIDASQISSVETVGGK